MDVALDAAAPAADRDEAPRKEAAAPAATMVRSLPELSTRTAGGASRTARRARQPAPERNTAFDGLSLPALRAYRQALSTEETRAAYWCRLIQTRLDLVRSGRDVDTEALAPLLTQERGGEGRQALVEVLPVADEIPPLPDLATLWSREPLSETGPGAPARTAALLDELSDAQAQFSAYHTALLQQRGQATDELIARYRQDPRQCLAALPQRGPGPR